MCFKVYICTSAYLPLSQFIFQLALPYVFGDDIAKNGLQERLSRGAATVVTSELEK